MRRRRISPRLWVVILWASGCASSVAPHTPQDPMVSVVLGSMEIQAKRLKRALEEYERAARADDDPFLLYRVATLHLRLGQMERAAEFFSLMAEKPHVPLPWLRQAATVLERGGRAQEALKIHVRILEDQPQDHPAALAAARILVRMGRQESALRILERAGPGWPSERGLALERARLFLELGKPEALAGLCESPPFPLGDEGTLLCARAWERMGLVPRAVDAYVACGEGCHEAVAAEAFEALLRLGSPDEAAALAGAMDRCEGGAGAWATRRALALVAAGRLEEAEEVLHTRLGTQPTDVGAWELLAVVSARQGRLGRAESILERALVAFPQAFQVRERLAALTRSNPARAASLIWAGDGAETTWVATAMAFLVDLGYPDLALRKAYELGMPTKEIRFQAAAAWERMGCVQSSLHLFEPLLADSLPEACNYVGYMLAERGLFLDRAENLIRCALAAEPDNPYYLDSLGWVYFKQGRAGEAEPLLRRALELDPGQVEVIKHLGLVLLALGRVDEAKPLLEEAGTQRPWDVELWEWGERP